MKIRIDYGHIRDVYAVYWIGARTFFLATGHDERYGLNAYEQDEVVVVDDELSGDFVYYRNKLGAGIYHWALIKEKLLDDVLEMLPEACARFFSILKAEGRY